MMRLSRRILRGIFWINRGLVGLLPTHFVRMDARWNSLKLFHCLRWA